MRFYSRSRNRINLASNGASVKKEKYKGENKSILHIKRYAIICNGCKSIYDKCTYLENIFTGYAYQQNIPSTKRQYYFYMICLAREHFCYRIYYNIARILLDRHYLYQYRYMTLSILLNRIIFFLFRCRCCLHPIYIFSY